MILDSNILIYSLEPQCGSLREYLAQAEGLQYISLITKLEVLGFHRLRPDHKLKMEQFLRTAFVLPITEPIITEAIRLRQQRKRSLADSIIAATGLLYNQPVLTNNVADFADITGLRVVAMADILRS